MALYLPLRHIVIDIIDDPYSMPVDTDAFPGCNVIPLTISDLQNTRLMGELVPGGAHRASGPRSHPKKKRSKKDGGKKRR